MSFKYFISSSMLMLIEKVTNIFFGVAVSVLVARILGPSEFGSFSVLLSISLMLSFVVNLGCDGLIVKKTIESTNVGTVYGSFLQLKLLGFIIYAFAFFAAFIFTSAEDYVFFIAIALSIFCKIGLFFRFYFEANKDFVNATIGVIGSRIIAILFIAIGLYVLKDKKYLVFYLVIDSLVSALFYFSQYARKEKLTLVRPKKLAELARQAAPYAIAAAIFPIFMQIDVVMLGFMVDKKTAGIYSAVNQMVVPFSFVGFILISVLFPVMVKAKDRSTVIQLLAFSSQTIVLISYSFILFMWLFGDIIIGILYGPDYSEAKELVKMMSIVSLFSFSAVIYSRMLVYESYAKFGVIKSVAGVIINLILNYYLIPPYGATGAISASIVAYSVSDLVCYLMASKVRYIGLIGVKSLALMNLRYLKEIKSIFSRQLKTNG